MKTLADIRKAKEIKEYKMEELQKFIKENEKTISEHPPKGWK
ncbi:MAG: hypothetical protein ABSB40_11315 [Nitrososphaeria archaeon]